jgi:hypothetical protein
VAGGAWARVGGAWAQEGELLGGTALMALPPVRIGGAGRVERMDS